MSTELYERIAAALADEAQTAGALAFTADDVFRRGRIVRARRRVAATLCAGLAVAVIAVLSLAGRGGLPRGGVAPGATETGLVAPSPQLSPSATPDTTSPPTSGVAPATIGLSYANGRDLFPATGGRVTVDAPAELSISSGERVPGGWVLDMYGDTAGFSVWFQPDSGTAVSISAVFGNTAVSPDGRTLVVAGDGGEQGATRVAAYRLPSLVQLATTTFSGGLGALTFGIAGDEVVLRQAQGDGSPAIGATWNVGTGIVTPTDQPVSIWGVSDDGHVLRRVTLASHSCVDAVPASKLAPMKSTGLCSAEISSDAMRGALSPDGARAVLVVPDQPDVLVATADLQAGRWRPTAVPGAGAVYFWDTATSFVAAGPGGTVQRCTTDATCTPIGLPAGQPRVALLPNRDAPSS